MQNKQQNEKKSQMDVYYLEKNDYNKSVQVIGKRMSYVDTV